MAGGPVKEVEEKDEDEAAEADGKTLKGKTYDKELRRLQAKLCHLQEWVKDTGQDHRRLRGP
jgi:polyphosphate kinase 2 (PPK2 family)